MMLIVRVNVHLAYLGVAGRELAQQFTSVQTKTFRFRPDTVPPGASHPHGTKHKPKIRRQSEQARRYPLLFAPYTTTTMTTVCNKYYDGVFTTTISTTS